MLVLESLEKAEVEVVEELLGEMEWTRVPLPHHHAIPLPPPPQTHPASLARGGCHVVWSPCPVGRALLRAAWPERRARIPTGAAPLPSAPRHRLSCGEASQ